MPFVLEERFRFNCTGTEIVSFCGFVTAEVINCALDKTEQILFERDIDCKLRKKVYHILVESLQNVFHHTENLYYAAKGDTGKLCFFIVENKEDGVWIKTGNYIPCDKIGLIKSRIEKINSLSQEEIKEIYKFILNHQKHSEKGGGGLGFLDIARKSGFPLVYSVTEVNDDYSFFQLDIHVA
jgi:hypothetical protein